MQPLLQPVDPGNSNLLPLLPTLGVVGSLTLESPFICFQKPSSQIYT